MLSIIARVWLAIALIWFPFLLWTYAGSSATEIFQQAGMPTLGIFIAGTLIAAGLSKLP